MMQNRMFSVFVYELRRNGRRKGYLFMTLGIPLLGLILVLGYQVIASRDGNALALPQQVESLDDVIDVDGIQHAGYVDKSGMFGEPGELADVLTRFEEEAAVRTALDAGTIDVYYVIEPDYLATGQVTLVMPTLNISDLTPAIIRRLALNTLARDVGDPALLERLANPANYEKVILQRNAPEGNVGAEGAAFAVVYIFAMTLLFSLFVTNGYLMQSVIEEKETRLIEILIASARPMQLLGGKILALGLLGLGQIAAWLAGIFLILRVAGGSQAGDALAVLATLYIPAGIVPLLLVYFALAYLMFASAYSIVGALSNSMREGPQYAAIFTLPAVIPLWFTQIFASTPDAPLPVFLSLFPITAPLGMIQRLAISDVPPVEVAVSVGLLALTVVGMLWLAGRVFRVQTLLAGHAPSLRELPRLLRG